MQTANVWDSHDRAAAGRLRHPRHGSILVQREVSAPLVIVDEVALAANHVGNLYGEAPPLGSRGMGFGLTVEVVVDSIESGRRTSPGSFGWDGAFGTHFWVDRKEQLTGLLMIQQALNATLNRDFENAVMQAIID